MLKSKNSYSRSVAEGMIKNNNKDLKDINVSITPRFKVTEENCPGGMCTTIQGILNIKVL